MRELDDRGQRSIAVADPARLLDGPPPVLIDVLDPIEAWLPARKHLRTAGGKHEIDLIVERDDGRVIAIEVKLARDVSDRDTRHLRWLANQIGDELLDAVLVTTGNEAYRRREGVAVVPAALLGP